MIFRPKITHLGDISCQSSLHLMGISGLPNIRYFYSDLNQEGLKDQRPSLPSIQKDSAVEDSRDVDHLPNKPLRTKKPKKKKRDHEVISNAINGTMDARSNAQHDARSNAHNMQFTNSGFRNSRKFTPNHTMYNVAGNHGHKAGEDFNVTDRVFRSLLSHQVKDQYEETVNKLEDTYKGFRTKSDRLEDSIGQIEKLLRGKYQVNEIDILTKAIKDTCESLNKGVENEMELASKIRSMGKLKLEVSALKSQLEQQKNINLTLRADNQLLTAKNEKIDEELKKVTKNLTVERQKNSGKTFFDLP
jgi:hypothetical protein